jgi:hypothetical protein
LYFNKKEDLKMLKKEYIKPETCVIVLPASQPLLAGSIKDSTTGFEGSFNDDDLDLDGD